MEEQSQRTYPPEVLQVVINEGTEELARRGLLDKVAVLAYNDKKIELGFYSKADSVVEIVKSIIDKRAPGVPLEIVENVTVKPQ